MIAGGYDYATYSGICNIIEVNCRYVSQASARKFKVLLLSLMLLIV